MKVKYPLFVLCFFIFGTWSQIQGMNYWQGIKNYFGFVSDEEVEKYGQLKSQLKTLFDQNKWVEAVPVIKGLYEMSSSRPSWRAEINAIIVHRWATILKVSQEEIPSFANIILVPILTLTKDLNLGCQLVGNFDGASFESDLAINMIIVLEHRSYYTPIMNIYNAIVPVVIAHIKEAKPGCVERVLASTQSYQLAQVVLTANRFPDDVVVFARDIIAANPHTPTLIHLKNYRTVAKFFNNYKLFHQNPQLQHMYSEYIKKEEELNKKGYYTFTHGQMRHFYFPERLYTHLWGLRKHQSVANFFFMHVKDLVDTQEAQFEEDIARRTIHMAGAAQESGSDLVNMAHRKKVLFMNYAFFANATNIGSHSPSYVTSNQNSPMGRETKIFIQEPFKLLGYEWVYDKYRSEIEQLAQDYNNLSPYGNMFLIAVPKDKIYKYVYSCKSGGLQNQIEQKDGTKIFDIRQILDTLLNDPRSIRNSDTLEFCLIMTQKKGGLDPSTGIQIYPLLSGDPEKLKVLQEREKNLLDKITTAVKEFEKQQALQRAAKITGHVVDSSKTGK